MLEQVGCSIIALSALLLCSVGARSESYQCDKMEFSSDHGSEQGPGRVRFLPVSPTMVIAFDLEHLTFRLDPPSVPEGQIEKFGDDKIILSDKVENQVRQTAVVDRGTLVLTLSLTDLNTGVSYSWRRYGCKIP